MSVIVKGMEMPKNCQQCQFIHSSWGVDFYCALAKDYQDFAFTQSHRMPSCPLVVIPTPHGVLKDTTAFDERIRDRYCKKCERRFGIKNGKRKEVYEIGDVPCRACDIGDMLDWLDDAFTVIEAEGSEA